MDGFNSHGISVALRENLMVTSDSSVFDDAARMPGTRTFAAVVRVLGFHESERISAPP